MRPSIPAEPGSSAALGGLPANCTFGPPPEDLLAAIVTGTSPALLALDAQPNPVP